MSLKDFKIQSEAEDSYHLVHPSGRAFTVEKKSLNEKARKAIEALKGPQKFDDGGAVRTEIVPDYTSSNQPYSRWDSLLQGLPSSPNIQSPDAGANAGATAADISGLGQSSGPAPAPPAAIAKPVSAPSGPIPTAPQQPNPLVTGTQEQQALLQKQLADAQAFQQQVAGAGGQAQQAWGEYFQNQPKQSLDDWFQQHEKANSDLRQAVLSKQIDPDRYMKNMSTGSKVMAGIAMALGGMGAGRGGQNLAYETINNAISRDIDAQKNDQSRAMNLFQMNREQLHDEMQAKLMTQNQMLAMTQARIAAAGANAQSAQARFSASQVANQIQQQIISNKQHMGMLMWNQQGGGGAMNVDPAMMIPPDASPELKKKALDEVEVGQNAASLRDHVMKAFDDATKEATVVKTVGGLREPEGVTRLKQLVLPLFKDIDGTVRQAAMDETYHNIIPTAWDSNYTGKTQARREALQGWLDSKSAAPTFKNLTGMDLKNFASTSPNPAARLSGPQLEYYNWAKANSSDSRAAVVLQKLGVK